MNNQQNLYLLFCHIKLSQKRNRSLFIISNYLKQKLQKPPSKHMDHLRHTILSELELTASKSRFGLFSQPPPLAIGDDSRYNKLINQTKQNGKVIIQPRNIITSPSKTGRMRSSFFKVPNSIYIGDSYIDPERRQLIYKNNLYLSKKIHEKQFKTLGSKTLASASYKYLPHGFQQSIKKFRDDNGRVVIQPRKFQTNTCKKVEELFMKFPQYISDPYSRKQQLQRKESLKKQFRIGQKHFRSMCKSLTTFNKPQSVYGSTQIIQPSLQKQMIETSRKIHQRKKKQQSFRTLNTKGGFINKFPRYIDSSPEPTKFVKRLKNEKQIFKSCQTLTSRPTPSIVLNAINLRRAMHL